MKKSLFLCIVSLLFCLCSCDKEDEINEYRAGIFEALNGQTEEYSFIESTYEDAFRYAGLLNGHSFYYMQSTSRDKVMQACSSAEATISDAKYDFKGYYVFEVKENGQRIYFKTYGKK